MKKQKGSTGGRVMPVRPSSPAQREAVRRHDSEKVDKITVRLPKGTKEEILATGQTVNTFVIDAVIEKLGKKKDINNNGIQ